MAFYCCFWFFKCVWVDGMTGQPLKRRSVLNNETRAITTLQWGNTTPQTTIKEGLGMARRHGRIGKSSYHHQIIQLVQQPEIAFIL